ncbi:transporter substrate-binding domain-containing protein [Falsochrobactrum sp. TDYN1]|uniref:Transporter substrate-binding domain-containing protein n=1 Tax=Falsochrobactrum tianjinense TaxID=2706015 RepID=A0A949UUM9_9HYPH|nr:transporter substrate-binding domain-containing protein [Falsochrobactrum sp. TDYN1]MBV2145095.1 transporter substrate-binding domain-containing protein [Falsochrobactrum sp. TDYN1]
MTTTNRRNLLTAGLALSAIAVPTAAAASQSSGKEPVMERVARTGELRLGAVAGGAPFTYKDIASGEWRGFCVDFAKDIAATFGANLKIVETTWGNAVLDLEADKIDLFFGMSPTPKRALVVDFCNSLFMSAFAMIRKKGFEGKDWVELNDPSVTIAVDVGSSHDQIVTRLCPNAKVLRFKSVDEGVAAVQAGRADCQIVDVFLALTMVQKNPQLGKLTVPQPAYGASTNGGFRREDRATWRDFVNVWINYQKNIGGIREIVVKNMEAIGVSASTIPEGLDL